MAVLGFVMLVLGADSADPASENAVPSERAGSQLRCSPEDLIMSLEGIQNSCGEAGEESEKCDIDFSGETGGELSRKTGTSASSLRCD